MSKTIGAKLLRLTPFAARYEGVDVIVSINGQDAMRMDYQTALKMATIIKYCAKHAKRQAGDESWRWTAIADLTDANADELELQKSRDGTAVYSGGKH